MLCHWISGSRDGIIVEMLIKALDFRMEEKDAIMNSVKSPEDAIVCIPNAISFERYCGLDLQ